MERRPGNIYGEDKEPSYSILSYTWGRFQVSEGPRVEIKGIDWTIPTISEDHFRTEDLTRVLNQARTFDKYIWIDIACIDQKRYGTKMAEIGRQASIFMGARRAYIWLNKHEPQRIRGYLQTLMCCAHQLANGEVDAFKATEDMMNDVSALLQDPWFSSLWTLQESLLQKQAVVLDQRGEPVTTLGPWNGSDTYTRLFDISGAFSYVRNILTKEIEAEKLSHDNQTLAQPFEKLQEFCRVIEKSGIGYTLCPNPNILYAAAAFRTTTNSVDRIYAIMQVYGYALGDSAKLRWRRSTLDDLELQFLKTLNSHSMVLGQAFQHMSICKPGESWCINNDIRIPERFHMIILHDQFMSSNCKISIRKKNAAFFQGQGCSMRELLRVWDLERQKAMTTLGETIIRLNEESLEESGGVPYSQRLNGFLKVAKHGMVLDHSIHYDSRTMSYEWPPDTVESFDRADRIIEWRIPELARAAEKQQGIVDTLIARFGEDAINVLYLGRAEHIELMNVALIIVREEMPRRILAMQKSRTSWRRIGICFWHSARRNDLFDGDFHLLEGKFG
ncbi:hypothetical protein MMC22_001655 [Lobaria immixta]|nr:hypothetical protein [Lobaria immixta]